MERIVSIGANAVRTKLVEGADDGEQLVGALSLVAHRKHDLSQGLGLQPRKIFRVAWQRFGRVSCSGGGHDESARRWRENHAMAMIASPGELAAVLLLGERRK